MSTSSKTTWGLLPEGVLLKLKNTYWQNSKKLKSLLSRSDSFPLAVPLKSPRGNMAIQNIGHFQNFVSSWKSFSQDSIHGVGRERGGSKNKGCEVIWEKRNFRSLAEQDVPTHLNILDIGSLACILGSDEERQLQKGMGQGCYLRALPVTIVDTKFIEKNLRIIESIVTVLVDKNVKDTGLMNWLDCKEKPMDWLLVKPLCQEIRSQLGGLPLLRLSSDTLQDFELPARNILVIENEQSCLALSGFRNTIAVSGGGKNVSWMRAGWLADKNVGYWGDIDSEGLAILSDARSRLSSITPLMMDELTVKTFAERMVPEPDSLSKDPIALTETELALFKGLRSDQYADKRLEQERLPMEYVAKHIDAWVV